MITFKNGAQSTRNGKFLKVLPDTADKEDHATADNQDNGTTPVPVLTQPAAEQVEPVAKRTRAKTNQEAIKELRVLEDDVEKILSSLSLLCSGPRSRSSGLVYPH